MNRANSAAKQHARYKAEEADRLLPRAYKEIMVTPRELVRAEATRM
jgi:hypothetical protein